MRKTEYQKLVAEYGQALADKALLWFVENHSEGFRKAVKQASYIIHNEYLWRAL